MNLTILGASGATGRELTRQALHRGHLVTAIARNPNGIAAPESDRLIRLAADVREPGSIARALEGSTAVLSGLGVARGDKPGALAAGARAVVASRPERIVWLGAFGTGVSAHVAGRLTRTLLRVFLRAEMADKVEADTTVLDAGGIVFHAGPLSEGPLSDERRTLSLEGAPRRLFPARVSRANVAAAMLDAAEARQLPVGTLVPVDC